MHILSEHAKKRAKKSRMSSTSERTNRLRSRNDISFLLAGSFPSSRHPYVNREQRSRNLEELDPVPYRRWITRIEVTTSHTPTRSPVLSSARTHACTHTRAGSARHRRKIRVLTRATRAHVRARTWTRTVAANSFKEPRRYRRIPSKVRYRHVTKERRDRGAAPGRSSRMLPKTRSNRNEPMLSDDESRKSKRGLTGCWPVHAEKLRFARKSPTFADDDTRRSRARKRDGSGKSVRRGTRPLFRSPPFRLSSSRLALGFFYLLGCSRTCAPRCAAPRRTVFWDGDPRSLPGQDSAGQHTARGACRRIGAGHPPVRMVRSIRGLVRDMARENTAANGKIVPDGTNECLENDDERWPWRRQRQRRRRWQRWRQTCSSSSARIASKRTSDQRPLILSLRSLDLVVVVVAIVAVVALHTIAVLSDFSPFLSRPSVSTSTLLLLLLLEYGVHFLRDRMPSPPPPPRLRYAQAGRRGQAGSR